MSKDLKEIYALTEQQLLLIQRYFMSDTSDYANERGMQIILLAYKHSCNFIDKYLI